MSERVIRSIDIALTQEEAGENIETLYENACTFADEPDLSFNYATADELNSWGFSEGCFTCFLRDSKDIIIQAVTTYRHKEGASCAYNADVNFLKKNDYGTQINIKKFGEASVLFEKRQDDGTAYNLLFLKNTVFIAISAKYKVDKADNIDHITRLAEKIEGKILDII